MQSLKSGKDNNYIHKTISKMLLQYRCIVQPYFKSPLGWVYSSINLPRAESLTNTNSLYRLKAWVQEIEWSIINVRFGSLIPSLCGQHNKVSLGKILNPKLLPKEWPMNCGCRFMFITPDELLGLFIIAPLCSPFDHCTPSDTLLLTDLLKACSTSLPLTLAWRFWFSKPS